MSLREGACLLLRFAFWDSTTCHIALAAIYVWQSVEWQRLNHNELRSAPTALMIDILDWHSEIIPNKIYMTFLYVQTFQCISAGSVPDVVLNKSWSHQLSQHSTTSQISLLTFKLEFIMMIPYGSFTLHPHGFNHQWLWCQWFFNSLVFFRPYPYERPHSDNHQWWWRWLFRKVFPEHPHDPMHRQINTRSGLSMRALASTCQHQHASLRAPAGAQLPQTSLRENPKQN